MNGRAFLVGLCLLLSIRSDFAADIDPATREKWAREDIRNNEKVLKKVREAFAKMKDDTLSITRIQEPYAKQTRFSAEKIEHYDVMGRCEASGTLRDSWETSMLSSETYGSNGAMCFYPGLLLEWKGKGGRRIAAWICLACSRVSWNLNGRGYAAILSRQGVLDLSAKYLSLFDDPAEAKHLAERKARWEKAESEEKPKP